MDKERCGIIYADGSIKELQNLHSNPETHFAMLEEDILVEGVIATFHTHLHSSANLSVEDYKAFSSYPELKHYIISTHEIWCFATLNGILCVYENTHLPRFPQDLMPSKPSN